VVSTTDETVDDIDVSIVVGIGGGAEEEEEEEEAFVTLLPSDDDWLPTDPGPFLREDDSFNTSFLPLGAFMGV
jgi:hypothetical protein